MYREVQEVAEKSFVEGSKAEMELVSRRLPMIYNEETHELFEKLRQASLSNGLGDLIPIESVGGSDGIYTTTCRSAKHLRCRSVR